MNLRIPWIGATIILLVIATLVVLTRSKRIMAMVDDTLGLWPVPGYRRVTSPFGPRTAPTSGASSMHKGIDIAAPIGTPIVSPWDGKVVVANSHPTGGVQLVIQHNNGKRTGYAHLSSRLVALGDTVERGQRIALVGNTGTSTGPHLHFSLRPAVAADHIDPMPFLA